MGASEEGSRKRKQLWTVCCQEMEVILRLYILSIILEEWNRVKSIIGKAASVADVNRKGGCLVTFIVRTMFVLCVCVIRLWSVFFFFFLLNTSWAEWPLLWSVKAFMFIRGIPSSDWQPQPGPRDQELLFHSPAEILTCLVSRKSVFPCCQTF